MAVAFSEKPDFEPSRQGPAAVNLDTVRATVRGQLHALIAVDLIVAQSVEDAIVAGIHVASGADPVAEPHRFTEDEVLAMSVETEVSNAAKRAADIAADPSLEADETLTFPGELAEPKSLSYVAPVAEVGIAPVEPDVAPDEVDVSDPNAPAEPVVQ